MALILGRNIKGTVDDSGYAGYKAATKYVPSSSGISIQANVWADVVTSNVTSRAMLYSDNTGSPGALLAVSADITISPGTNQTPQYIISHQIISGTPYWICVGFDGGGGSVSIWCEPHGTGSHVFTSNPTASNPFGSYTVSSSAGDMDIWVTYNPMETGIWGTRIV